MKNETQRTKSKVSKRRRVRRRAINFKSLIVVSIIAFIIYCFVLPPLNICAPGFWIALFLYFGALGFVNSMTQDGSNRFNTFCAVGAIICIVVLIFGGILCSEFFNARRYQRIITVQNGNFNEDITQIEINQLPILDRDSAEILGDRKMGVMVDHVSQFEVANDYTQINISNRPVRTTPLEYGGGLFKWLNNAKNGVPGYINVDMVTQEAELVRLKQGGMKYVPSAYFGKNLERHLRFRYPTFIFDDYVFEIDDEGNPWYIVPVVKKTIFMFGGKDIKGAVILNPITGDSTYYDIKDVPQWVDRVYPVEVVIDQLNWYGTYKNGWWNTKFSKQGMLQCTEGYNYIAKDDDIWLYTGFTSVGKDESNVGFMLVNMRTKEAKYYACPGAEEYSAMKSARGAVTNYRYEPTFPLLINVNDEPTYLMALKDNASLVKMYALVNVESYQIVSTGNTLNEAFINYSKALMELGRNNGISAFANATGRVIAVKEAVKAGDTYYYLMLDGDSNIYVAPISVSDELPFTSVNDEVFMEYIESGSEVKQVMNFDK